MSSDDTKMIGKAVNDMYGTPMGKVVGTITDIDGSTQAVGVDCGPGGLQQVPFDQLVVQEAAVIFIPKWRLDSQRLLREKGLTLRRIEALAAIISESDEMREDASVVNDKYRSKLDAFDDDERGIREQLERRLGELDEQMRTVKMLAFDARIRFKSSEIPEQAFESVRVQTASMTERITHETAEINSMQRRIADLGIRAQQAVEEPAGRLQDSAVTYLGTRLGEKLPAAPEPEPEQAAEPAHEQAPAPIAAAFPEPPGRGDAADAGGQGRAEGGWLDRMQAQ